MSAKGKPAPPPRLIRPAAKATAPYKTSDKPVNNTTAPRLWMDVIYISVNDREIKIYARNPRPPETANCRSEAVLKYTPTGRESRGQELMKTCSQYRLIACQYMPPKIS